jgi:hypothetical protein
MQGHHASQAGGKRAADPSGARGKKPASSRKNLHRLSKLGLDAKSLGLSVSTDMPDDVLQLLTLDPQPVRTQSGGGVEYLPL